MSRMGEVDTYMDKDAIIKELISQMKSFLEGIISKEEYEEIAEETITRSGKFIQDTDFYRSFMDAIPDLCLYNIDEPGGDDEQKDKDFMEGMRNTYEVLVSIAEKEGLIK